MRAGDSIKHTPSGAILRVSATQGDELIAAAFGTDPIPMVDCELTATCTDEVHMLTLKAVAKQGDTLRAAWAAATLEELEAGS